MSSFSSSLEQVWNILFLNTLHKKKKLADQRKTFISGHTLDDKNNKINTGNILIVSVAVHYFSVFILIRIQREFKYQWCCALHFMAYGYVCVVCTKYDIWFFLFKTTVTNISLYPWNGSGHLVNEIGVQWEIINLPQSQWQMRSNNVQLYRVHLKMCENRTHNLTGDMVG